MHREYAFGDYLEKERMSLVLNKIVLVEQLPLKAAMTVAQYIQRFPSPRISCRG